MGLISLFIAFVSFTAVARVSTQQRTDNESPVSTEAVQCNCETRIWTCPQPLADECAHGLVPDTNDPCACCKVCGNGEMSYCDLQTIKSQIIPGRYFPYQHTYGVCGEGLTCKTNFDVNPGSQPESVCFCDDDEMVCGTNGKTYDNICHLREKNIATKSKVITEASRGRCPGAPKVVTPPKSRTNSTGERIVLHCEIVSFPDPTIEWRKEGVDSCLPGDNMRFTVHTSGGPDKFEHTTFLQIIELEEEDEGFYHCVATNKFGDDMAGARVNVRQKRT
ncbi:insulin-like growth factor-binding protein-related protein 1 [Amphiura filiformis]|uniref:insulin-like growth factor-binding protein-related protein 1 n=1 Tax=Amphiura filiformis TaxID=82378 RepID=UPI003B223175